MIPAQQLEVSPRDRHGRPELVRDVVQESLLALEQARPVLGNRLDCAHRQQAMRAVEAIAENRARLLERQERFLHDVTHELRTPVTIARGHLELLGWDHPDSAELVVALDELARIERIINRLLLLAKVDRPDFLATSSIDVEVFVEELFVRWSDVAPRVWRLGRFAPGTIDADAEARRAPPATLPRPPRFPRNEFDRRRGVRRG